MLTMPDVKLLAHSFMASLGLVSSISLSIFLSSCHFLSRWLILCGFLSSGSRRWSSAHDGGGPLHLHSENQSAQCRHAGTSSPINVILVSPTNCAKPSRSSHSLHFTSVDHTYLWQILFWLHRYYLNWTELDDAITEFNNEMPSTENWVFNLVILH